MGVTLSGIALLRIGCVCALVLSACSGVDDTDQPSIEGRVRVLESELSDRDAQIEELRQELAQMQAALESSTTSESSAVSVCEAYSDAADRAIPNAFDLLDEATNAISTEHSEATRDEQLELAQGDYFHRWGTAFQNTLLEIAGHSAPVALEGIHGDLLIALNRGIKSAAVASLAAQPQTIGGQPNPLWAPRSNADREVAIAEFDSAYSEVSDLVTLISISCS